MRVEQMIYAGLNLDMAGQDRVGTLSRHAVSLQRCWRSRGKDLSRFVWNTLADRWRSLGSRFGTATC
jgi:hypothetical protein